MEENNKRTEENEEIKLKNLVIIYLIAITLTAYHQYTATGYTLILAIFASALVVIFMPILHIAVFSLFKSKRTTRVRKRILKGWFILLILASITNIYQENKSSFSINNEDSNSVVITEKYIKQVNKGLEKISGTKLTSDIIINSIYMTHSDTSLRVNYYAHIDDESSQYTKESLLKIIDKSKACSKFLPFIKFSNVDDVTLFIAYRFNNHKVIDVHVECI